MVTVPMLSSEEDCSGAGVDSGVASGVGVGSGAGSVVPSDVGVSSGAGSVVPSDVGVGSGVSSGVSSPAAPSSAPLCVSPLSSMSLLSLSVFPLSAGVGVG